MKRKVFLSDNRYITCEVTNGDNNIDIYEPYKMSEELVDAMRDNGYYLKEVQDDAILVDRTYFFFKNGCYILNQCSDLFEWFGDSQIGDFTYYYNKVVFHAFDGRFYAADIDDTTNYIMI